MTFAEIRGTCGVKNGEQDIERILADLAEECLELGKKERPEKRWLEQMYDRFRAANGNMGKGAADALLYRKMYGAEPAKPSDTLKIRYWRTGRHLPVSREQCGRLGKALELSGEESVFLIQGCCDRCDRVFEAGEEDAEYRERLALLEELKREYLEKVHPALQRQLYHSGTDLSRSLRHLYYTDAGSYLHFRETENRGAVGRHISSINYTSEFGRQMKLYGEIPRKTMIRHLLIFASPFVNEKRVSAWLKRLGYLGLDKDHTQTDRSCLDRLLLGYLRLYEECCTGKEPEECRIWLRRSSCFLDGYLEERKNASLRLFYFKALKYWEEAK